MANVKPTFWMTPREILDPSKCDMSRQRALITYNILFNGPLVISDSDFINNLHLRDAVLRSDRFVTEMIELRHLLFAIREDDGNPVSLAKTAEGILHRAGHVTQIPAERFGESPEFLIVERKAKSIPFSLKRAGSRYLQEVHRIFRDTNFREEDLPEKYARAIAELCAGKIEARASLNWSEFLRSPDRPLSDLWKHLEAKFPDSQLEQYGPFIQDVARGPYATFLPEILNINPTFSSEDRIGVDIWRGRYELSDEILAQVTLKKARLSLVDMAAGLAALQAHEIAQLRDSAELQAYESACEKFSEGNVKPEEALKALHEYRRLVDDAIFRALRQKPSAETVADDYRITARKPKRSTSMKEEGGAWLEFLLFQGADILLFNVPSFLKFGYERVQVWRGTDVVNKSYQEGEKAGMTEAREHESEKEVLMSLLQRSPALEIIEAEVIADRPSVRDLCTSFERGRSSYP